MHSFNNYKLITFLSCLFISTVSFSQYYNTSVEAKIVMEDNNEFITISGSANNKTEISQSIRYVLSVIKTDPVDRNVSKNNQSGRLVLQPLETKSLSTTTINSTKSERIVILLLVYDTDNNIIGKDRILLNGGDDNDSGEEIKQDQNQLDDNIATTKDVENKGEDGVYLLKGIVVEDTKTKPGRDFFKLYSDKYNVTNIRGEKIITIAEIFALGRNTKIEVRAENEIIFQFFLRPKEEFLKEMADYAIQYTQQYFKRLRANKDQLRRY